jgi:U3 small nucleolar RNA-associated protein MPP10
MSISDTDENNKEIKYDDFYGNGNEEDMSLENQDDEIEHGIFEEIRDTDFSQNTSKNKSEIEKLEEKLIKEKSWQLKGEVRGVQRPVNSLLQEALEFQTTNKEEADDEVKVRIYK